MEEIRTECGGLKVEPDTVYMATVFAEFTQTLVLVSRGVSLKPEFTYDAVSLSSYNVFTLIIVVIVSDSDNSDQ